MIASVRGTATVVRLDHVVVEVGGVGLKLAAPPATLAELRPGQPVELATSLVVREDSLSLFGFLSTAERDVFETVQTVSGIGPRLALAMLAVLTPAQLQAAVEAGDLTTLCKVPGVGRKGAQRLVLELAGKLQVSGGSASPASPAVAPQVGADQDQVVQALVGLGWNAKQAQDVVAKAVERHPDADVPTLLRAALRSLGKS